MYTPKNDVGCPLHCLHVEEGYTGKLCYVTIPGGVPGNSFALPDVDVVCSKETATGLPRFEKGQDRPSCKQWERKRLTRTA